MPPAISVRDLRKSYGDNHAVKGVSFEVETGEVLALLGPNGAGKTTTVEILEGFRSRTSGEVSVLGVDPDKGGSAFRQRIGIVLQECGIDSYLSVREVITMHGQYYAHPRDVDEVIELVGLQEKSHSRVKTLSGGQQRRLDVALGLIGDPELLFLDEPTTGFDPSARRQSWDIVANLTRLGKTVLLTTHYMDEAQALANRVIVIARGRIVAEGTPDDIGGRDRDRTVIRFTLPPDVSPPPMELQRSGQQFEIASSDPTRLLHDLTNWAVTNELTLGDLEVRRPSLEDVYLRLTADGDGTSGDNASAPSVGSDR
ncbi:MAG: ABC transporter ATP-binding protein [Acidimicrobiia bacterium]